MKKTLVPMLAVAAMLSFALTILASQEALRSSSARPSTGRYRRQYGDGGDTGKATRNLHRGLQDEDHGQRQKGQAK